MLTKDKNNFQGFAEINQDKKKDEHIEPCFASGIIMSGQPNPSGHVCGTSGGVSGLSGGPVFDLGNIFDLHKNLNRLILNLILMVLKD